MIELKPCPFCGRNAIFSVRETDRVSRLLYGTAFVVQCKSCRTSVSDKYYHIGITLSENGEIKIVTDEREKAIKAWNRRIGDGQV